VLSILAVLAPILAAAGAAIVIAIVIRRFARSRRDRRANLA